LAAELRPGLLGSLSAFPDPLAMAGWQEGVGIKERRNKKLIRR